MQASDIPLVIQNQLFSAIIRFIALGEDAAMEATNLGIDISATESFNPDADGVGEAFDNIGGSFAQQTNGPKCDQLIPGG